MSDEGVVHRHDHRRCWDCNGVGLVERSVSQVVTDRALQMIGWRYLEPHGRMVCSECAWVRRHPSGPISDQKPPTRT